MWWGTSRPSTSISETRRPSAWPPFLPGTGQGLATKALTELLAEVTERPLFAYVALSNVASIRVLEKCGFELLCSERHFDETLGVELEEALMVLS